MDFLEAFQTNNAHLPLLGCFENYNVSNRKKIINRENETVTKCLLSKRGKKSLTRIWKAYKENVSSFGNRWKLKFLSNSFFYHHFSLTCSSNIPLSSFSLGSALKKRFLCT